MTIKYRPSVWGVTYYAERDDGEQQDLFHSDAIIGSQGELAWCVSQAVELAALVRRLIAIAIDKQGEKINAID